MTATDKRLDPAGTKDNLFIGRTDTTPRPSYDGPFGLGGQESLKRDQAKWDFAKAWDDEGKEHRARFLAELDAKKRSEEQARRDADEVRATDEIRKRYLRADRLATEEDFQQDLPEIRRQMRIQAVLADPAQPTGRRV